MWLEGGLCVGDKKEVRLQRQGLGYSVKVWLQAAGTPKVI